MQPMSLVGSHSIFCAPWIRLYVHKGVIFLGTPQKGTDKGGLAFFVANSLKIFGNPNMRMLRSMKR